MPTRRQFLQGLSFAAASGSLGCGGDGTHGNSGESAELADDTTPVIEQPPRTFTTDGIVLGGQALQVDLPLLHRVHALDDEMNRGKRRWFDHGFGYLGLMLARQLKNGGYWCTPKNSLAFGRNGGDGFHFNFLVTGNRVDATTPVIGSAPDNFADPPLANVVLAASFENFLRLGLMRGYFGMYVFVHEPAKALAAYGSPDWKPTTSSDEAAGLDIDDRKRDITRDIAAALGLTPLAYSEREFQELQDQYMPQLRFK